MRFEALLRSGIAAVTIAGVGAAFLILGVAAVSWRTQCAAEPGAGICFGAPAAETVAPGDPAAPEFTSDTTVEAVAAATPEMSLLQPEAVAEIAPETAVAEAPRLEAEPAPIEVASLASPPAEPVVASEFANAAEMMASTFEALTQMKAAVNAAAVTGGPVVLPTETELADSAAPEVEVAVVQPTVAASAPEPAPAAADVAVAEAPPPAEIALPRPQALAVAQTGAAPTKRTVKVISVGPEGVTESAAATAAAAVTVPLETAAIEPTEVLAFANPAATPAPRQTLEVNDNLVNVRAGPSTDADKLWVLKRGDEVVALATAGEWVEVEISEDKAGWMLREFLAEADLSDLPEQDLAVVAAPEPVAEPEAVGDEQLVAEIEPETATELTGDVRTVRGAGVNVRSAPSSSAEKLFALPGGRKVSVGETERGWLKITDENGRTGWLYEDYVSGS